VTLPIVDTHAHIFPTPEMGRRWLTSVDLADHPRDGSIGEARRVYAEAGIAKVIMLLYLRAPVFLGDLQAAGSDDGAARRRVREMIGELNMWGCAVAAEDERFIPFVGVDVRFMDEREIIAEIDKGRDAGAKGVKIVPPSMKLYGDDPLLRPVYRRCVELQLPVLSQSGRSGRPENGGDVYGRPIRFAGVLEEFPALRLILAHLGRDHEDDVEALTARFPNVYADTSHRLTGLGRPGNWTTDDLVALFRRVGMDRILFGTNYPMTDPRRYVEVSHTLPLTDAERSQIAHENVEAFLTARV
jgi:predicted TIM-barrel fold metal-dependent hydrolase